MAKTMKGKEWFKIHSPKHLGDHMIGETPAIEAEQIMGRIIDISLTDLTGDPSRYYMKLFFKINKIDGNNARTVFVGHECTRDFISRVVQLRTDRIDTNNIFQLEGCKVRIKTITVTNRHVTASISTEIRKTINSIISEEVAKLNLEKFIAAFTSGELQQKIRAQTSKIYPIRAFEFRKTEVI
jgi:small subunit ribosomal protein S3Ae